MPKFIFAYHGGRMPETDEEVAESMAKWRAWLDEIADSVVDEGNPAGMSKTVTPDGVEDHGGANPLSGYSLVEAPDMDAALEMARGCPILDGGTVEVAEAIELDM